MYNFFMNSNKRNVFLFFIGDKERISFLLDELDKKEFNVILGPTNAEHDFLYSNYPYYRKSYDLKIWAFCSDVWRLYKLSTNIGLYMDTSVKIGDDFTKFYDKNIQFKTTLFKEATSNLASAVMFSGIENNSFYKAVLKVYEEENGLNPRLSPLIGDIISAMVTKEVNFYGFGDVETDNFRILGLMNIRNENELMKIGSGSWGANSKPVDMNNLIDNNFWKRTENSWLAGKDYAIHIRREHRYMNSSQSYLFPTPLIIRDNYDKSNSKEERKFLNSLYKSIEYKVKFRDKLLWSKMYVFFTFKWLKTK